MSNNFLTRHIADWNPALTSTRQFIQQLSAEMQKLSRLTPSQRATEVRRGIAAVGERSEKLVDEGIVTPREAARLRAQVTAQMESYLRQSQVALTDDIAARKLQAVQAQRDAAERLRYDQQYLLAKRQAAEAAQAQALAERAAVLGIPQQRIRAQPLVGPGRRLLGALPAENDDEFRGRVVAAERIASERHRLHVARQLANVTEAELRIEAETQLLQRQRQRALHDHTRALIRQQVAEGGIAGGSPFQRVQAFISNRQGGTPRLPDEFLNFGQFLSSRMLTTAGFAVSGLATYGAFEGIREAVQQATELQLVLKNIQEQLRATDAAGDFPQMRAAILDLSRNSGAAVADVAQIALQMRGAFTDTQTAIDATTAAVQIMRVTGIDAHTAINDLVAISKSFNITIEEGADLALAMQDRFGILAKEVLNAMGVIAPVAQLVGLSAQQAAGLVTVSAQVSGRSAATTAEQYNRILPALGEQAVQIIQLYQSIPALAGRIPDLAQMFGQGEYGKVLVQLISDSKSFNVQQRNMVIEMVGQRRESQALAGAFQQPEKALKAMNGELDEGGRLVRSYNASQETLAQQMNRMRREFQSIAEGLLRAGLGNALHDVGVAIAGVLQLVRLLVGGLAELNEATGGWALRLGEVVLALRLVSTLGAGGIFGRGAGGAAGNVAAGAAQVAAAQAFLRGTAGPAAAAPATGGILARVLGAGGGLAGTGVTPAGLALVGAATAGITYATWRTSRERAGKTVVEELQKLDNKDLEEAAKSRAHVTSAISAYFSGTQTRDIIAKKLLAARQAAPTLEQFRAANQQGLPSKLTPDQLDVARAELRRQGYDPKYIDELLGLSPAGQPGYSGGPGIVGRQGAVGVSGPGGPARPPDANRYRLAGTELIRLATTAAEGDERSVAAIQAILKAIEVQPGGSKALSDALARYKESQGKKNLTEDIKSGAAIETAQGMKTLYDAGIVNINQYLAEARRMSSAYRALAAAGQLKPEQQQAFAQLQADMATVINNENQKAVRLQRILAEGNPLRQAQIDLDAANRDLSRYRAEGLTGTPQFQDALARQAQANNAVRKAQEDARIARLQLLRQFDSQDPLLAAQGDQRIAAQQVKDALATGDQGAVDRALIQQDQADIAVIEAQREINRSRIELLKARHGEDPVEVARQEQELARQEAEAAVGEAAQNRAEAAKIAADRTVTQALQAIGDARLELLKAMRTAAGDPVGAAQITVQQAMKAIADARARGVPEESVLMLQLQRALVQAQADSVNTQIQTIETAADQDYQLRTITVRQYIGRLRDAQRIATTDQERKNLEIKIRQLLQQTGQDMAFNIPAGVQIPTLYQVRRFEATRGAGFGYNDNRNFDVKLYITNGMEETRAKQFLADVFGVSSSVISSARNAYP